MVTALRLLLLRSECRPTTVNTPRPGGAGLVTMDVDGFHDGLGIALEVEAGRACNSNAVHRTIFRAALLLDAQYLALLVPSAYKPPSVKKAVNAYENTRALLDAIYTSQRLHLPFKGVLLIGYPTSKRSSMECSRRRRLEVRLEV
jgi:hypothetical protein